MFTMQNGWRPAIFTAATVALLPIPTSNLTAQSCHQSYAGVCVPAGVSDVDCQGGQGDGPFYVRGPIQVVGPDVYGLDRNGDGIACER